MKNKCKKEAQETWFEWKSNIATTLHERVTDNYDLIVNDHQKMVQIGTEMIALKASIKEDLCNFAISKGDK